MKKLFLSAFALVSVGVSALIIAPACGSVCGNGVVESGEQCDNGMNNGTQGNNCNSSCQSVSVPRASLVVSYQRLKVTVDGVSNYASPTCTDLGIANAKITLSGPQADMVTIDCSQTTKSWDPIMPGMYTATIQLFDSTGNAVTKPKTSMPMDVQIGAPVQLQFTFDVTDYLRTDYQGVFYFVPSWGTEGTYCLAAGVTVESVTMTADGASAPLTLVTDAGHKLDGTGAANCFSPSAAMTFEKVLNVPWGYYTLKLVGSDASGGFCHSFHVFAGIGVGTPTYQLVAPMAGGDAGACP
jgi:hypothetical protein